MLKLRKPFSQKVHLHIRQDLLQNLWEKYIPSSSDKYDQIQLIYLDAAGERQTEQSFKQIQLTLHFVLRNRMIQMAMNQYSATLFPGQQRMQDSLRRMERYYLTQLRGSDRTAFQRLNRYITLLDQTETANRRYRHWQTENQLIEKQWKEYGMLSLFSVQVRDVLEKNSFQTMRKLEKEYIDSLTETEYQALMERFIWQERESLTAYLKTCDEIQCRQIIERLGKEKELCRAAAVRAGIFESPQRERKDAEERESRDRTVRRRFSGRKYARIKPEKREITIQQILNFVQGRSVNEKLAVMANWFEQKEFQLFYRQAVNSVDIDNPDIIWKAEKKNMISCLDEMTSEEIKQIWKQISVNVIEEDKTLQEKYHQEAAEHFHSQLQTMLEQESFQGMKDLVDVEQLTQMVLLSEDTTQVIQTIEQQREIQEEKVRQQEIQAFETYQEIYGETLKIKDLGFWQQERMVQAAEEMFRKRHQGEMTTEEMLTVCEWSRLFLKFSAVSQEETELVDRSVQEETELIDRSVQEQAELINKSIQEETELVDRSVQEETELIDRSIQERTELIDRSVQEQTELIGKSVQGQMEVLEDRIEWKGSEVWNEKEEWIHLIRQINDQIEEKISKEETYREENRYKEEKAALFWQKESQEGQEMQEKMQKMLMHIKGLKDEQRTELIHNISELVLFWHQIDRMRSSVLGKTEKISSTEFVKEIESRSAVRETAGVELEERIEPKFREMTETEFGEATAAEPTENSYQQLWEWGEALLFHTEQEADRKELDILSFSYDERQKEDQEDLQTGIIRRQIEAAKDRNYLQQLVMQINHRISSESIKEDQEQTETFPLVYTDSQLGEPSVQKLISYLRKLDEVQYETFVKELSQVTKMQRMLYFGREEEVSAALEEMIHQKNQSVLVFVSRRQKERYRVLTEKLKEMETSSLKETETSVIESEPEEKYFAAVYPMLAHRIQEYEEQQIQIQQEEINKFEQIYFDSDAKKMTRSGRAESGQNIIQEIGTESGLKTFQEMRTEPGRSIIQEIGTEPGQSIIQEIGTESGQKIFQDYEVVSDQEILQHSIQRTQVMEEEQERRVQRMQEEAIQLKTAQGQLEQKMKEVELQLRKVEGQTKAKEDTRAFAEQIKSQLYEELHVEKLRRGLI